MLFSMMKSRISSLCLTADLVLIRAHASCCGWIGVSLPLMVDCGLVLSNCSFFSLFCVVVGKVAAVFLSLWRVSAVYLKLHMMRKAALLEGKVL